MAENFVPLGGPYRLDLSPGATVLDKYRVVQELGVGGMGVVVAAEHLTLGTRVALKFLLPQYANTPEASARFVREARAASRIVSSHVVGVLDVGVVPEGLPYIMMEYLEGEDLGKQLARGQVFPVVEAVDFVVQAAEALARAHRAGIVHRDIKPANLFLTRGADEAPLVKILDFGVSKTAEEDVSGMRLTKSSNLIGSGLYMSPEQMRSPKNVDTRTDIFALGVSLYELLTNSFPWMAESYADLALKVNLEPPEPIRKHRKDVPGELAQAIARAHAVKVDDRWPTVGAFAAAIAPFGSDESRAMVEVIQRIERGSATGDLARARASSAHIAEAVREEERRGGRLMGILIGLCILGALAVAAFFYDRRTGILSGPRPSPSAEGPRAPATGPPVRELPERPVVSPPERSGPAGEPSISAPPPASATVEPSARSATPSAASPPAPAAPSVVGSGRPRAGPGPTVVRPESTGKSDPAPRVDVRPVPDAPLLETCFETVNGVRREVPCK